MRKKFIVVSLGLLIIFLALAILTGVPLGLQAKEPLPSSEGNGHLVYDSGGEYVGCVTPGSSCMAKSN